MKQQGGLDVRLRSPQALATYMEFRGLSVRELAARAGAHRSTVGHLRSGKRDTCAPVLARRIAKILDVPTDVLFAPRVLRIARHNASPRKAA